VNKWKNYGLWVSLASTVLLVLQVSGVGIDSDKYNLIVNSVLGTLAIAGIISNPSQGNGYSDK
jgi:uncharacterized membrane protein